MNFISVNFRKPTNALVAAIQNYCVAIVKAPGENGIIDLDTLQVKLELFIDKEKHNYPKCNANLIETEVHSYKALQVLNLIQGEEKILISLCSRRSEYQRAFEEYDRKRINYKWPSYS